MFGRRSTSPSDRWRRGAATLLAGGLAFGGLGVMGSVRSASAAGAPLCEVVPERCQTFPTFNFDPYGALDAPSFASASVRVTGWAGDPNTSSPIDVIVTVDGVVAGRATAGLYRAANGYRGFDLTVPASPASAQVCVTGVNVGRGSDATLGCAPFPYSTDVTLRDPCNVVKQPLLASKWLLPPPSVPPSFQAVQETTTSSAGRIGFVSGPASPGLFVGLSLSDSSMTGPLFRSSPMSTLPAGSPSNPNGRLTVDVACSSRFPAVSLNSVATGLSSASGVTITSATLTPAYGTMMLNLTGTASVFGFPTPEPFKYSLMFTVTPSTNMNNPAQIVVVNRIGPAVLNFTGSSGWYLNTFVAPNMEPGMTAVLPGLLETVINRQIATDVSVSYLSMGGLPAGATISAPQLIITPYYTSLITTVGRFG